MKFQEKKHMQPKIKEIRKTLQGKLDLYLTQTLILPESKSEMGRLRSEAEKKKKEHQAIGAKRLKWQNSLDELSDFLKFATSVKKQCLRCVLMFVFRCPSRKLTRPNSKNWKHHVST